MKQLHELRPDGRKLVVEDGENSKLEDLPELEFTDVPRGFKTKHLQALGMVYSFGIEFAKSGRAVPLIREEWLRFGIEKQTLKDLEHQKLIESYLVEMKVDGRNVGGKKCIVISPEGRAVAKFFLTVAEEQARVESPAGLQTDSAQEVVVEASASSTDQA